MKRQTLLMMSVLALVLLVLGGAVQAISYPVRRAMRAGDPRTVALGALSLQLPRDFRPSRAYQDGNWTVQEYSAGILGTLRLATEPGDGTPWEDLCARWFRLPAYPKDFARFEADGFGGYFREVPLFGRGAYALAKRGKQLRLICCFEREGTRHWIGLDTRNAIPAEKALFDGLVRSLRLPDGTGPGPGLEEALRAAGSQSGWRFLPPVEIIFAVPAALVVLVLGIQLLIQRRAGRLPDELPPSSLFAEGGLELGLAQSLQRKFMDCAVVVTPGELVVHTFGKPLLTAPRTGFRVELGQAWLGLPFVKLVPTGELAFRKWAWFYGRMSRNLVLRIYTRDAQRLATLLLGG